MRRDIDDRYYNIKVRIKAALDKFLVGRPISGNSSRWWFMCHENGANAIIYPVNASQYVYDLNPQQLKELLALIEQILNDELLEGGENNIWALAFVSQEIRRGTVMAYQNLSRQSELYAERVSLSELLMSPGYANQIQAASIHTFSDWKGISDAARADLANIIIDAVARGVNTRETARVISKRIDVSHSKAKTIAQTEQLGALRAAQRSQEAFARERLGLRTALLWISALLPTTRAWHGSRHGRTYTDQQVENFYARDGNQYNCYCSQIPALLDENGKLVNPSLVRRLAAERFKWQEEQSQKAIKKEQAREQRAKDSIARTRQAQKRRDAEQRRQEE